MRDVMPESMTYRDSGCRLHPACLTCPFPVCVHETIGAALRATYEARRADIQRRFVAGESVEELAAAYEVTPRTIYRALGDLPRRREDDGRTVQHRYRREVEPLVLSWYEAGVPVRTICQRFGLTKATLARRVTLAGKPLRTAPAAAPLHNADSVDSKRADGLVGPTAVFGEGSERVRGSGGGR